MDNVKFFIFSNTLEPGCTTISNVEDDVKPETDSHEVQPETDSHEVQPETDHQGKRQPLD